MKGWWRMSRVDKRKTKGHGCLGFTFTLTVLLAALFVVLFFTTNLFGGIKKQIYGVFYPRNYSEQVSCYAAEFNVDEPLVYAVIRTESGFREDVESYAGAIGLMQLMPSTFDWLQEKLEGDVIYTTDSLKTADVNIRYGTYFLALLLDRYDGNLSTACAAYNAGTTTVDGWLGDTRYSADGRTLSVIPYAETEQYIRRIEKAEQMYRELYYN